MKSDGLIQIYGVRCDGPVKGICFHHKRPWIVMGLSSGVIQIWNYDTKVQLNEFQGHSGSVQSVQFSIAFPLIVSGGCDGKIKVCEYDEICSFKNRFALEGHSAKVNDVQFHHELPWIVSASDDCSVRLWNWKSRSCIAVLSNHTGAVTSSSFHPRKHLILSSSLDRRLCIWDVGGLATHNSRIGHHFSFSFKKKVHVDVLQGHTSGVVRAIFHPTLPIIFSASDECSVYSWNMEETHGNIKHQTIYRMTKGVPLLAYSTKLNSVMCTGDNDEEKIYLYDGSAWPKTVVKATFDIRHKGLSSLCSHPTRKLFAVGNATGMRVYRAAREPPALSEFNETSLYYVKDKILWCYDYHSTKKEARIVVGPIDGLPGPTLLLIVVKLSCSPQGDAALICKEGEGGYYILVVSNAVAAKGDCLSAVFVGADRFALLTRTDEKKKILSVRSTLKNEEVVSECVLPCDIDTISLFPGLRNHLLVCKATDRVVMFDLHQQIIVSEISISSVYYIFWMKNQNPSVVALVGKYFITMANQNLERLCTIDEDNMIESGMWDVENHGVFIYKTWKNIKYCLVNGESGTIMAYREPLFITRISGSTIYGLDENGQVRAIRVDATEYVMKAAILNKDYMKQCCCCNGTPTMKSSATQIVIIGYRARTIKQKIIIKIETQNLTWFTSKNC